jgi:hypothetical protein
MCTIYTRLNTCLMSISRFSLRDKVTLRLLNLYFNIAVVLEWSRALDIRLSDWCCSVSIVWVQIRRGKKTNMTAQRPNSNTVWFNFQTYIIFSINLVSQVILISSGTDIVYGCHLLRCLYNILYFLWMYNEFFIILYNITNCWVRLLSNYHIKYICTIYTRLNTCLMSI